MPNSPPAATRQRLDLETFQTFLETLHLGSSFATAADVEATVNLLVNRIREAQSRATALLLSPTSRRVTSAPFEERYARDISVCGNSWTLYPKGDLFITPVALHRTVLRLPKKKAPGSDGISTATLKHFPRRAMMAMNRVFYGILRTDHFPETWKGENHHEPKSGEGSM
ncbi:Probable RNA-directed DNA polymerase from transposon X-element [Eumeta japonica]|uniref:Probable RNA-directed DNA polymerase from transposon X-element n=1 Tax=Eumeta variegata TaxID=151549 RepID=A0A4C1VL55_EUMVA|nr:Probable RNA-directed DNA polymerase from transposon X-element [Eumeta japonica]